jgi:hypothetical protein
MECQQRRRPYSLKLAGHAQRSESKTMRRTEKEIGRAEIDSIIRRSQVCRLGLSDQGAPYVVPLCFGYDGQALYFHCAKEGRKLDILRRNERVCFEFDIVEGMVETEQACGWTIRYQSVIGFGRASVVETAADKERGLAPSGSDMLRRKMT